MVHQIFLETPIGIVKISADDQAITEVKICRTVPARRPPETSPLLQRAKKQVEQYFSGKRKQFALPLKQPGTEFQKKVWAELEKVPYGKKVTYQELAARVGKKQSFRAVGNALGKNQIPLLVPCHRVVSKSDGLGGFSLGLNKKEYLLGLEDSGQR